MLVYISGPYRADTHEGIEANIQAARKAAIQVWESGNVAICPHLNTAHFEIDAKLSHDDYIMGDIDILARCDHILMLPGWENSEGSNVERDFAMDQGIPVSYYPDVPERSMVEVMRPNQVHEFINVVMKMYRVHLTKNQDYSPANILGTGEVGLMTRTWDKISRLMNLMGFKIEIKSQSYNKPLCPKHESIDDSIIDFSVYGVIWQLYRKGVWGI